jgi:hypothetical protein
MRRLHLYSGAPLTEVDHEPKIAVLDQEDLIAQGIDTSVLIPGAQKVDALGSCTANGFESALSNVLSLEAYLAYSKAASYDDTMRIEKAAISFYHGCTDQTGDPTQEWPPTDCGSSGPYVVEYAQKLGLIGGDQIASGAQNIVSMLQADGILQGTPFLNAWMDPPAGAIVDGDGSASTIQAQIASGVAGGHETYISAIVKLTLSATGLVDPENTIVRVRNSWTKSWGDNGSFYLHLSSLVALGQYSDFRQLVA